MTTLREPVLAAVGAAASLNKDGVELLAQQYEVMWGMIGGPAPALLTPEDAPYLAKLGLFNVGEDQTWDRFKARIGLRIQLEADGNNPYLPMWAQKTEDRQTPWLHDCGAMDDDKAKQELSGVIRASTPALNRSLFDLFQNATPVGMGTSEVMFELADAMATVPYLFLRDRGAAGTPDPIWRWGATLCELSFLGLPAMRRFFRNFGENEDIWHWATCSFQELFADIQAAQQKTSYACGIHWPDYGVMSRVLHRLSFREVGTSRVRTPEWYQASVALHVFKHVRLMPNTPTGPRIFAAYRGQNGVFDLPAAGLLQSMTSGVNIHTTREICRILGLAISKSPKAEWYETAVSRTLGHLQPRHLIRSRPVDLLTDLIVPPGVRITQSEKSRMATWICPDIQVDNLARVDLRTGKVDTSAAVSGFDALAYSWPTDQMRANEYHRWSSTLPKVVQPARASAVLRKWLKNINDLGHWEGFAALLDATMTLALMRSEIGGCPVGNVIDKEFPLVFVLPTGVTAEATTNQGKTTLCRLLAGALMPGVEVSLFSRLTSAPAQRTLVGSLEKFCGGILDEFVLPKSSDHVFNQAGLQNLATGGQISPGKAMENAKPFKLRFPLFFNAKVAPDVPDLINRSLPIFMDALTDDTTLSEEALQAVMSGYASVEMRASHLMWMQQNCVRESICGGERSLTDGTVQHVPALKLAVGSWRFNGHLAVAYGLSSRPAVDGYLLAARAYCAGQLTGADASGLTEDIGYRAGFDTMYFWREVSPINLERLSIDTKLESMTPSAVLREMVEDGERRKFPEVMRGFGTNEIGAVRRFVALLKAGPLARPGWRMRMVTEADHARVFVERTSPSAADQLVADMKATLAPPVAVEIKVMAVPPLPPVEPSRPKTLTLDDLVPGLLPNYPGFYDFADKNEETPKIGTLDHLFSGLHNVQMPDFNGL